MSVNFTLVTEVVIIAFTIGIHGKKIDRPSQSKIPEYDEKNNANPIRRQFDEYSTNYLS